MEVHLPAAGASDHTVAVPVPSAARRALAHVKHRLTNICAAYTWCTLFVSLGGFIFGYDTGSIGPVTVMPQFEAHFEHLAPAKHGIIVSSILLTASVFSLIAGPLADRISRTYTLALSGVVIAIGEALCVGSGRGQLAVFIAGRCITGAGAGLLASPMTTYTCEIAPTHIRGRLCYGSVRLPGDMAWRIPYIIQVCLGCILAVGCMFLPHSPRWLRHVGRGREADLAWARLGVSAAEAEKEEAADVRDEHLQEKQRAGGLKATWRALWTKGVRSRTILGVFLQAMNNASGVDGVLYYAPLLFSQAGLSTTTAAFLASGATGLVNVAVTIPTLIYSDTWGRRPSLIWGGFGIATTMLLIGTLYASHATDAQAGRIAVIVMIFLFLISFAMSWAVVVRVYASEIQPTRTRAAATALGQAANWIVNWLIAFSTPLFLAKSSSGPYFLFGGCSLATAVVCYFFSPESRGISLEDLDKAFEGRPWESSLARFVPCIRGGSDGRNPIELEARPRRPSQDTLAPPVPVDPGQQDLKE